eukprot:TRINITY_DN1564_c0_g2_i1.p1 TRINITY_DN1564_c0_g2~~TRINITY_DN1564_c0_g2_i1.p1  ORF type:complete len:429 (-),score=139.79 TRINITY_DN1564_c0_g2_i1:2-1288(-)
MSRRLYAEKERKQFESKYIKWANWQLRKLVNFDDTVDVVDILMTFEDEYEISQYVKNLELQISPTNELVERYINEFIKRKYKLSELRQLEAESRRRVVDNQEMFGGFKIINESENTNDTKNQEEHLSKKQRKRIQKEKRRLQKLEEEERIKEEERIRNRRLCNCQATQHELIGNCLRCGKIICEQEGEGNCLFCELLKQHNSFDKKNDGNKTKNQKKKEDNKNRNNGEDDIVYDEAYLKALEAKERLLDFDRNSSKRTVVYDDSADYYSFDSTKWMNEEQREIVEKRKMEEEKKKKQKPKTEYTLDFAGRLVLTSDVYDEPKNDDLEEQLRNAGNKNNKNNKNEHKIKQGVFHNPFLTTLPTFRSTKSNDENNQKENNHQSSNKNKDKNKNKNKNNNKNNQKSTNSKYKDEKKQTKKKIQHEYFSENS